MATPRILIVDDEPDVVAMYTSALETESFEVLQAYDGIAAVDMAINDRPDVILLDIMMPMMSGFEVLQQIRSNPESERIPVVCVTSAHAGEVRTQVKALGAQAMLIKPFRPAELVAQVQRILARRSEAHTES